MVARKERCPRKRGRPKVAKPKVGGVRSREEINQMVARMLEAGITGLGPRMGAWCAGHISDADLLADFAAESANQAPDLISILVEDSMMHDTMKDALKALPGIEIFRQRVGTRIIVETDNGMYELVVLNPTQGLVEISGSDPRLHEPVIGRFLHSVHAVYPNVAADAWIGRAMRMVIAFVTLPSRAVLSLRHPSKGRGGSMTCFEVGFPACRKAELISAWTGD